jgi:tetratricopeptide (TPR) repeat protein
MTIHRFALAVLALGLFSLKVAAQEAAAPATAPAAEGAAAAPAAGAPAAGSEAAGETFRDPIIVQAYKTGVQLLADKKYKEAIAEFNKAIDPAPPGDPSFFEAQVGKGDALKALEDYQAAISAYSTAIQYAPQNVQALNGRGECNMELGAVDVAATDFSTALDIDPNNAQALSNYGHILVNFNRDPVSALRRLDDALAMNDKDARAYRDRGYAHVLLHEYDKAAADLQKAVQVDPTDYENYSTLASGLLLQDMYAPAVDALTKAIDNYKPKKKTDPEKFISGYLSRADARLKLAEKETDSAKAQTALEGVIADADAVLAIYPHRFPENGRAQFRKGRAERLLKRYPEAIDSFTDSIDSVSPGQDIEYMADAYMYRGICWFYIGEEQLARGDFEQASSTGSGYQDPRPYLWIGFTHHKQGDYREAITAYNQAIAKSPTLGLAYVNKGRAYMDLNEYKKAVECFNDAIRVEPSNGDNYYNTGYAYVQLKDPKKAESFLDLALQKKDPQPKMYRLMATIQRQLGNTQKAQQFEREADEAQSNQSAGPSTQPAAQPAQPASPPNQAAG